MWEGTRALQGFLLFIWNKEGFCWGEFRKSLHWETNIESMLHKYKHVRD